MRAHRVRLRRDEVFRRRLDAADKRVVVYEAELRARTGRAGANTDDAE
jgi:hypothetical protein